MSVPPVLNRHRDEIPEGAAYIGRPTQWGNPFSHMRGTAARYRVSSRAEAVAAYRSHLRQRLAQDPELLEPLRGATALVCFCAPLECHGDVIQEALAGIGVFA